RRAARIGLPAAQIRVAKLYMAGIGVEPDPVSAAAWTIRARRGGLNDAAMDDFINGLTDEQVRRALEKSNGVM
ncbi:MAG: sel1 repeat family protein, partial [Rhizobiaceae bacterium]